MKYCFFTLLLISFLGCAQEEQVDVTRTYSTAYFEIHNNLWVNLHHFLYQEAKGSQLRHLQEGGKNFMDIGDQAIIAGLSSTDKQKLNEALQYYKENLIGKSLRRDLGDLRFWLQQQSIDGEIVDTSFSKLYTDLLNDISGIYREQIWPIHSAHNEKTLKKYLDIIQTLEKPVMHEMELLSGEDWPDSTKIRVDLTTYANWAGAYTPVRPEMNIIISTIDESNSTTSFVETFFHEGSHLLFTRESPFRSEIYYKSEAMDIEFPRGLWHAGQFYLCGRATQDHLKSHNIEHVMLLDDGNIFKNYDTEGFRRIMEQYYLRNIDLNTMAESLLKGL